MITWRDEWNERIRGGKPLALRARCVLPIAAPPPRRGVITIHEGKVTAVGANDSPSPPLDLGDVAILPGLINAHTHLEFSDLQAPLGQAGISFTDWIREVVGRRLRLSQAGDSEERTIAAVKSGIDECLRCGVTAVGEIATTPALRSAAIDSPLGGVEFLEMLGLSSEQIEPLSELAQRHLAGRPADSPWRAGLSPHAPYSLHPRLLQRACRLSARRRAAVAMHLAESREELELLATGSGPFVALLGELGAWSPEALRSHTAPGDYLRVLDTAWRALVVHGNYLTDEEIDWIAARQERMSVVYCPRTQAFFRHEPYPLQKMLSAGVNVALGTDSRASSPDLNLWDELRCVADSHPQIDPHTILEMATMRGAAALGRAQEMGSIAAGKPANLVIAALQPDESRQPAEALLHERVRATATIVAGQIVAEAPV